MRISDWSSDVCSSDLRRMHGAVESLKHDLAGLRTGRAHSALLDPVTVEVYGAHMPLNQVASISAPEPRMLTVQVWDKSNVGPVDKAIRSAGLGLNPIRSEEHTSELQSLMRISYAVFCLKKKK